MVARCTLGSRHLHNPCRHSQAQGCYKFGTEARRHKIWSRHQTRTIRRPLQRGRWVSVVMRLCIYTFIHAHSVRRSTKPNRAKASSCTHTPWSVDLDVESAALAPIRTRMMKTMCIDCVETVFSQQKRKKHAGHQLSNHHMQTKSYCQYCLWFLKTKTKSGPQRYNHHIHKNRAENTVIGFSKQRKRTVDTAFQVLTILCLNSQS